jgi:hypothetical protein
MKSFWKASFAVLVLAVFSCPSPVLDLYPDTPVPEPLSVSITEGDTTLANGQEFTVHAVVSGGIAAAYSMSWEVDAEVASDPSSPGDFLFSRQPDSETQYTITCRVTDGEAEVTDSILLTVQAPPLPDAPVVSIITSVSTLGSGETITLETAVDYDGDLSVQEYAWYVDSVLAAGHKDASYVFSQTPLYDTSFVVRVEWTVDGRTAQDAVAIEVEGIPLPDAPTGFDATSAVGRVVFTWDPSVEAVEYVLYHSSSRYSGFTEFHRSSETHYLYTPPVLNDLEYYKLTLINDQGVESEMSSWDLAKAELELPSSFSNLYEQDSSLGTKITGHVKNESTEDAKNVKISFFAYDQNGVFLEHDYAYASISDLPAGTESPFLTFLDTPYDEVGSIEMKVGYNRLEPVTILPISVTNIIKDWNSVGRKTYITAEVTNLSEVTIDDRLKVVFYDLEGRVMSIRTAYAYEPDFVLPGQTVEFDVSTTYRPEQLGEIVFFRAEEY